jgi:primary-amine oxidase
MIIKPWPIIQLIHISFYNHLKEFWIKPICVCLGVLFLSSCNNISNDSYQFSIGSRSLEGGTQHPLDPLSPSEIETAVNVVKSSDKYTDQMRFAVIELKEPDKKDVFEMNQNIRSAEFMAYDWKTNTGAEIVVDISNKKVKTWSTIPSEDPPVIYLLKSRIEEILFNDPQWIEAMEKRGISSYEDIDFAAVSVQKKLPEIEGDKIVSASPRNHNVPENSKDRIYPIISVNLTKGTIHSFKEKRDIEKLDTSKYYEKVEAQHDLKPLNIAQREGPSFVVNGHKLNWQKWNIRFGINPRRGLEVYDVSFKNKDTDRKILYRGSLSEAVTPYGDPAWIDFYAIDGGDMVLANYNLRSIIPGQDVPPNTVFLDGVIHDHLGKPIVVPRGIAVFERDGQLLWRHQNESRRSRELVITSYIIIDNYDYSFSWIFDEAGGIKTEVLLSGVVNNYGKGNMFVDTKEELNRSEESYTMIDYRIAAPLHQHFFSFRLDFDVDGPNNSLVEINTQNVEGDDKKTSSPWFQNTLQTFSTEKEVQREMNAMTSRMWKVINPTMVNKIKQPTSYILMPMGNAFSKSGIESGARSKFHFLNSHLWATRYNKNEMYAGGKYTNYEFQSEGLPKFIEDNESIQNEDLVLWYTVGFTHMPRPEDWPVMPAHRGGFKLIPFGFFDSNPALNVPVKNPW